MEKTTHVLIKIALGIVSFLLSIPIIVGILAPMFIVFGSLSYLSWLFIGNYNARWIRAYYVVPIELIPFFIALEIFLFILGSSLFLAGLLTMVKQKIEGTALIQSGLYKYIRHPQNLGIILMFFPFTLYIPNFSDLGIRTGEIVSWGFFTYLICLYSYYEEWCLVKKFNTNFMEYSKNTGFFFPRIRTDKTNKKESNLEINFVRKISIATISFILLLIVYYMIVMLIIHELTIFK